MLTHELVDGDGDIKMSVRFGCLNDSDSLDNGWVGFKVGIRGEFKDYRDNAVRGDGLPLGITTDRQLFIGKLDSTTKKIDVQLQDVRLDFYAKPAGENYELSLILIDKDGQELSRVDQNEVDADWLIGGIALVSSFGKTPLIPEKRPANVYNPWGSKPGTGRKGNVNFWFADWKISGNKVEEFPERKFGPILFSQYTLSKGILKLTAQMAPVGQEDDKTVELQIKKDNKWQSIGVATIDALARTAEFKVENWDNTQDISYRLLYNLAVENRQMKAFYREGMIRKEPLNKEEIIVAGFTGNNDLGFPNNELVEAVKYHNPDVLFFSGDQIYEGVGGYGTQTNSIEKISLDYLRKWYLYGWAYGDLMRDRPTIAIPDDHDVYHGNIWGAGGIATPPGKRGAEAQDAGGYKFFAEWVNVVQRTQTSHLPDPSDPAPVEQGIDVYFCDMNYAGISFAIIEDRKFKSAPKIILPKAKVHNGWAQNRKFDAAKEGDVAGALLLGERQLKFLDDWSADWTNKTWMKVVLSQTIFANVATLPKEKSSSDAVVPSLKIFKTGEYPPDDVPVQDMDSNGWPQTGRNKALRAIRKGFAFHLAGDQHLGSFVQYGVDQWHDAGFAFCVPAISNVWPRRWFPAKEGINRNAEMPRYTGDFKDGFGNKITVHAVSNPFYSGKLPSKLYDRATGYGIVRLNRETRKITVECWPRWVDPSQPNAQQYPGWPVIVEQQDNYNRKVFGYLPEIKVSGISNPVIQVINEQSKIIEYTLRIQGHIYHPPVFTNGKFTVKIGDPDLKQWKSLEYLSPAPEDSTGKVNLKF